MLTLIHAGELLSAYWFEHGSQGDPKKFFDSLEKVSRVRLLANVVEFSNVSELSESRGHSENWDDDEISADLVLFKFKEKTQISRFYAVVHRHGTEMRVVIVHGFKGHQGSTGKRDAAEKAKAEARCQQYLAWLKCEGRIQ